MTTSNAIKRWRRVAAGFAVSALLLAACGDGGEDTANKVSPGETDSSAAPEDDNSEDLDDPEGEGPDDPGAGGEDSETTDPIIVAPAAGTIETDAGDVTVTERGVQFGAVDAPNQVMIISDARCPYCAQFSDALMADEDEWRRGDEVAVEHVMVTVLDDESRTTYSARAANILAVVADLDPANWKVASDEIYRLQPDGAEPTNEEITDALAAAGVNVDEPFLTAVEQMKFDPWNEETTAWARADLEIPYVPYALVNGTPLEGAGSVEDMVEMIKAELG